MEIQGTKTIAIGLLGKVPHLKPTTTNTLTFEMWANWEVNYTAELLESKIFVHCEVISGTLNQNPNYLFLR